MSRAHRVTLGGLRVLGTVEERFQSYNIEMVEVIGGRFWRPYTAPPERTPPEDPTAGVPAGMDPTLYRTRPPIDLSDRRLRTLAAALGPAYVRVSGTWANTVYFHDAPGPPPGSPPHGFGGVLTLDQWRGVVDFVAGVDGRLVSSFSTGLGVRDADGLWAPDQAHRLIDATTTLGGTMAAAELMNEPTYAAMGGAPSGYDAHDYGRDVTACRELLAHAVPDLVFLGPGSVGEGGAQPISLGEVAMLSSQDLLQASGPAFDAFSYHFYGAVSERLAGFVPPSLLTTRDAALSAEWLTRTDTVHDYYAALRDRFLPGRPMWLTETGQAAAGGDPWASTFADVFRYLYQLGSLARRGVQVVAHNTLASSDYGLLDEDTYEPRPDYWAALLWRRCMGTTVLDPGPSPSQNVTLFAHEQPGRPGSVTLLVINADPEHGTTLELDRATTRYSLSAERLFDTAVFLNATALALTSEGDLPRLAGDPQPAGPVTLDPLTIAFFVEEAR